MAKAYVLYNPIAGNGKCSEAIEGLKNLISDELVACDITKSDAYENAISSVVDDDYLVVCGGDGTLNRFINQIAEMNIQNDIRYYPCGSGNDFAREIGKTRDDAPFSIKKYIEDLPSVTIDGKTSLFLNGVGYGIDGYCCEVGDKQRASSDKPVNYTSIAIKGLLFHYKPTNAKVTVDGKTYEFRKVWIAPTMKGLYYGGGMMPAPKQDRGNADGKLSLTIFHDTGALKTLMIFPSIFKGEHVKNEKFVTVLEGNEITVEFDQPRSAQIDGETVLNVTSYTAKSASLAKNIEEASATVAE